MRSFQAQPSVFLPLTPTVQIMSGNRPEHIAPPEVVSPSFPTATASPARADPLLVPPPPVLQCKRSSQVHEQQSSPIHPGRDDVPLLGTPRPVRPTFCAVPESRRLTPTCLRQTAIRGRRGHASTVLLARHWCWVWVVRRDLDGRRSSMGWFGCQWWHARYVRSLCQLPLSAHRAHLSRRSQRWH